jgi:hypothetical protein
VHMNKVGSPLPEFLQRKRQTTDMIDMAKGQDILDKSGKGAGESFPENDAQCLSAFDGEYQGRGSDFNCAQFLAVYYIKNVFGNRLAVLNGKPGRRWHRPTVFAYTQCAVPSGKDLWIIFCLQKWIDFHSTAPPENKACLFQDRIGLHTSGPENDTGLNGRSVR